MFFLQQLQSNLVSLMRTDRHLLSFRSGQIDQMLSLLYWQRAVRSNLHITEMYGETIGGLQVSGLTSKTAEEVWKMYLSTNITMKLNQHSEFFRCKYLINQLLLEHLQQADVSQNKRLLCTKEMENEVTAVTKHSATRG